MPRLPIGAITTLLLVVCGACGSPPVTVSVHELDASTVRFVVRNLSDRDVQSLRVALTFRSDAGSTVRVDTVSYQVASGMPEPAAAFVRGGDDTFLVQALPTGSVRANARILEVTFMDGGIWSRGS